MLINQTLVKVANLKSNRRNDLHTNNSLLKTLSHQKQHLYLTLKNREQQLMIKTLVYTNLY
jgi:hypothetical protein